MQFRKMFKGAAGAPLAGIALWGLAMIAWACAASPAHADTVRFYADMSGASEIPPNDSNGKGHCDATLETDSNVLSWTCAYSGVSGPLTGAHFDGPVSYVGATTDEKAPIQAATAGSLASPFKGTAKIDAKQAYDLRLGLWYFDLHTKKYPGGEIRGPVVKK
jgi:hypothetical protein